ncbi:hypothetical protein EVAR_98979_1 [Eumeta japonica]|uniref:Uncharacterized protein n=1 Tax=Eumeta variegata TaxID=151549 RepID=A0A4C1YMR0_EUMVA|nr:hypothetical protein EVAR_98979_1 [Eumeta japonica]
MINHKASHPPRIRSSLTSHALTRIRRGSLRNLLVYGPRRPRGAPAARPHAGARRGLLKTKALNRFRRGADTRPRRLRCRGVLNKPFGCVRPLSLFYSDASADRVERDKCVTRRTLRPIMPLYRLFRVLACMLGLGGT